MSFLKKGRSAVTWTGFSVSEIESMTNKKPYDVYDPHDSDDLFIVDHDGFPKKGFSGIPYFRYEEKTSSHFYKEISPLDGNWQTIRDHKGLVAYHTNFPSKANRPFGLFKHPDTGVIYMSDYGKQGGVLDVFNKTNPIELFKHKHENPSATNEGTAYTNCLSVSPDSTKVALGNNTRDNVNIYDIATGSLVAKLGVPRSAGNVSDGKINNPYGNSFWIDNDTLAVPIYSGNREGSGGIYKYDINNPTAPPSVLMLGESSGGSIGNNLIDNPFDIHRIPNTNKLIVAEYGKNRFVKIADYTASSWIVEDIIYPPIGVVWSGLWGSCLSDDGSKLIVISQNRDEISSVNLSDGSLGYYYTISQFGLNDLRAVCWINDDLIVVCDWNAGLHLVPQKQTIEITYESCPPDEGMQFNKFSAFQDIFTYGDGTSPILNMSTQELYKVTNVVALFNKT